MDLCNEKDIRALLGRHGFRFSKSMGQNFLIEGWVPRDIAEAYEDEYGYLPERIYATSTGNGEFIGWMIMIHQKIRMQG